MTDNSPKTSPIIRRNRWWALAVVLVVGISGIIWHQHSTYSNQSELPADAEAEDSAVMVEVAEVNRGSIVETKRVTAETAARASVDLTPKLAGEVREVHVEMGDDIQEGDPLITLDDADVRPNVRQAEAAVEAARAQLDEARAGAREEEIEQARSAKEGAQAALDAAEWTYERLQRLHEQDVISGAELEEARMQHENARSQLRSAESQLELALAGAREETIRMAEAQLREAEGALEAAQSALEDTRITSPLDGTVAYVEVDPGDVVDAGMATVGVVDIDPLRLDALVTDAIIGRIAPGDEVSMDVRGVGGEYTGTISEIAPSTDPETGMYPVRILIDNPDDQLRPGMTAEAEFVTERAEDVIVVPRSAVVSRADEDYVFVVEDDLAQRRPVHVGLSDDEYAEIESGIDEGENVVDYGVEYLEDGMRVRVAEER